MATTPSPSAPVRAGRREWIALAVLALPLLLVSMDVSVLYFAVPAIARDLHATAAQQLWIFDVYGFVLAGLLITMGALADRVGAKRLLLIGALAFSATSVVAAYSGSAGLLIAARAFLGVAGATLMPSTMAMVRTMFHDPGQRARAVAIWTTVMTGGIGLGPVISGLLLDHFWWGSVFLVNLPAMALLLVIGPFLLPATPSRRVRFDLPGALLSLAAVLLAVYGIKGWATHGYSVRWPVCILVGLLLGLLFVRRQLSRPDGLVPAALLRNLTYLGAVGSNAIGTFALVGHAVFMTTYLQLVLGCSPLVAALWSLAPTLVVGGVAPMTARLTARFGARRVLAAAFAVGACGFLVLTRTGTDSLVRVLVGAAVLAGALVCVMTLAAERVLGSVTPAQAGVGAAVSEAGSELGGALGIALLGSIGAAAYRYAAGAHLPTAVAHGAAGDSLAGALAVADRMPDTVAAGVASAARAAYVHGLHAAALSGAALLLAAALTVLLARRREASGPDGADECDEKPALTGAADL